MVAWTPLVDMRLELGAMQARLWGHAAEAMAGGPGRKGAQNFQYLVV